MQEVRKRTAKVAVRHQLVFSGTVALQFAELAVGAGTAQNADANHKRLLQNQHQHARHHIVRIATRAVVHGLHADGNRVAHGNRLGRRDFLAEGNSLDLRGGPHGEGAGRKACPDVSVEHHVGPVGEHVHDRLAAVAERLFHVLGNYHETVDFFVR